MLTTRPMFNLRCLASQFLFKNGVAQVSCRYTSSKTKEEKLDVFSIEDDVSEEEIKAREAAIEQKRNKSELQPGHYNKQHGRPPYEEPHIEYHETLVYKRRLYGRYGNASKINPSILWPSREELNYMKEYEKVAQPFTFHMLLHRCNRRKAKAEAHTKKEEARILEKVKNVNAEIVAFHKRVRAQKEKASALIEHKNQLIERVRREIGYKVDVRDKKFKEMFDKLQKEEKKKMKLEKKTKKEELKQAEKETEKEKEKEKDSESAAEN